MALPPSSNTDVATAESARSAATQSSQCTLEMDQRSGLSQCQHSHGRWENYESHKSHKSHKRSKGMWKPTSHKLKAIQCHESLEAWTCKLRMFCLVLHFQFENPYRGLHQHMTLWLLLSWRRYSMDWSSICVPLWAMESSTVNLFWRNRIGPEHLMNMCNYCLAETSWNNVLGTFQGHSWPDRETTHPTRFLWKYSGQSNFCPSKFQLWACAPCTHRPVAIF